MDNESSVWPGATATVDEAGSVGRLEVAFERKCDVLECQWSMGEVGSPSTEEPIVGSAGERVAAREVRRAAIWRSNSAKRCREVRRESSGVGGVGMWVR